MADYAISNVPRRVVYAASGTGPYAFTFEILNQTDIAVYKASTLLTLTTDYTVTINANGTGSVTLVTTAGTSNITIVGAKNIQRTTDFTTGGDLFANTLNDELDNQTIFIQQVAETAERGLKAPVVDPTDINMTLPAKASRVGTVLAFNATTGNPEAGPSIGSVTTVAAQSANINTVASNIGSVNTVAGNITNVNTVAGVSGNVTTVASNIANVNAVGADLLEATSEINTVAVDIANVNTVGTNIASVNTVAGEIGAGQDVTVVAANLSGADTIGTVATNIANVNATGTNIANVNAVGSDLLEAVSEINTVATDITNVNTVGTNIASVNTVAGISGAVSTVSGIAANVTTVAGVSANVTTVAGISSNVTTVAGISGNVTTVAGISSDVTIAAANVADISNFADVYQGAKATDPTLRNDGSALQSGDLYFNTTDDVMKVREAGAWLAAYASLSGALIAANNLSDLTSASTARTNLGLGTIATQAASSVAITGGSINGTTIGATTASTGKFTDLTDTGLTSGRVIYAGTGGNLVDDADFTFNGTTVTMANDASISGLTVGKGSGAVATNTAVGSGALNANTTGSLSVAVGTSALAANTTSDASTAVGYEAASTQTTGALYTVAVGYRALKANTSGSQNNGLGFQALTANTTGSNNTGFGTYVLASNTTASTSSAFGNEALRFNTTGANNTAVGYQSLVNNTTASDNTAVGYQSLYTNTTGTAVTALGYKAGYSSEGSVSVYVGYNCGVNATGSSNTFIGSGAGEAVTSGAKNTIVGRYNGNQGGLDIRTAINNIVLSDGDGNPRAYWNSNGVQLTTASITDGYAIQVRNTTGTRPYCANFTFSSTAPNNTTETFLDCEDTVNQKAKIYSSGAFASRPNSYGGLSDIKLKQDIVDASSQWDDIKAIKVRKFRFKDEPNAPLQIGVVAQELEQTSAGLVYESLDFENDENGNKVATGEVTKSVKYSILYMKAIKALQEAMERIETLEAKVTALENK